jgi:preprotein translocase subunit SecF
MASLTNIGHALYVGKVSVDFVGRRRLWYAISSVAVALSVVAFVVSGFTLGIEFKGGVEFTAQVPKANEATSLALTKAVETSGVEDIGSPLVNTSGESAIRVQTHALSQRDALTVIDALQKAGATEVSQNLIGPSWGAQVASKALIGLVAFLVAVSLFIWAYFREWRMSVAALLSLFHDVILTAGVYAISGFEVTPATVTAFLTILGYSLYDTVVVFDKVRENTKNITRRTSTTYAEQANRGVNQTVVRSINTTVAAMLPVAALLVVGVFVLGSGPLKDLSLALFVGVIVGAYSSLFLATPLAVGLKEREPAIREHTKRVLAKRAEAEARAESLVVAEPSAPPRPVTASGSAKRNQPERSPRSKRNKGSR